MKLRKNAVRRAIRGNSFNFSAKLLRVSLRNWDVPENRDWYYGFRFVIRGKP